MSFVERQDDKYRNGKSRTQGANGVTQGNQGWKSQYQNSIVNSLSKPTAYQTPQIKHKLTTQEGFNEALSVVGARNNAKLDMQNRKVLSGVFGSLLSSDAQKYGADQRYKSRILEDKTKRRGQDLSATDSANKLAQTATRDGNMKSYYDGLLSNQKEGNRINEIKANTPKTYKPKSPLDEKIDRQKLIKESQIGGMIDQNKWDMLTSDEQKNIEGRYIQTGELPMLGDDGDDGTFWDTSPKITYASEQKKGSQSQGQEQKPQEQPQSIITGKMLKALAKKEGVDRGTFVVSDDNTSVTLDDGGVVSAEKLASYLGM